MVGIADAATKSCPSGTLGPLTTPGPSADSITAKAATALAIQATVSAGTATVQVEVSCNGTSWAQVTGSVMTFAAPGSQAVSLLYPTCAYRVNATACAACTVVAAFSCSGP